MQRELPMREVKKQPTLINIPAEKKFAGSQRSFSEVASCEIWILGIYS